MKRYLAFDLGASNWRAILGVVEGNSVHLEELARYKNKPIESSDGIHWNIQAIFEGMKDVLKKLSERNFRLSGIGIDSWSVDYGLLDGKGNLLETPRCYMDQRHRGMSRKMEELFGKGELFKRTALMAEDFTTLCQLAVTKEQNPNILDYASSLLFIPDLLRFWLCGVCATDYTLATTSQLYNIIEKQWDEKLIKGIGVPYRILPQVMQGPSILSVLSAEIQAETGMGPIPVITGASHDTAAAFSTINPDPGVAILSSGSWSVLGVPVSAPRNMDLIDWKHFGFEGNVDGSVRLICNIPGMMILERCQFSWSSSGTRLSYNELTEGAVKYRNFNSFIDPYSPLIEKAPDMPLAINTYCKETGQRVPENPFQTAIAIFRGLSMAYESSIREIERITKNKINVLYIIGGASRNKLLNEIIGTSCNREVRTGEAEASAFGNIKNQIAALKYKGKLFNK